MAEPVIPINNEEDLLAFMDTKKNKLWPDDYSVGTGLYTQLNPDKTTWRPKNIDEKLSEYGYNTRAVGFFYDEEDYATEIG